MLIASALALAAGAAAPAWVHFHSYSGPRSGNRRLDYFYAPSSLSGDGDRRFVRMQVLGRDPRTVILYAVEIDCRRGVFTEKGTTVIEPDGSRSEVPAAELWVDRMPEPGTSAEVMMKIACR